jgi:hexosaminidase
MINLKQKVSCALTTLLLGIMMLCSTSTPVVAQSLIPAPLHMNKNQGLFLLNSNTKLYTNLKGQDKKLMEQYLQTLPYHFLKGKASDDNCVLRLIVSPLSQTTNKEAYRLSVTPKRIEIQGNTGAGLFYGIQTLLQLSTSTAGANLNVPCVEVNDQPRFGYRGFMFDVSRHFFSKEFILKQIAALSYYKINVYHFHIVDTGGWRIEIKKYPNLTKMTAYRPEIDWNKWWEMHNVFCSKEDTRAYGGYYTQDDIREIVRYAAIHHVTVIPEIDMPGHSNEVLFAYPQLACVNRNSTNSGELCIGKEETFQFCENVLKEIIKLFPSKYIHIGGDEANRTVWSTCPLCQKRMKDEKLKSVADLQNYFTCRIEKFLKAHGRTIIGWDEILDGDVTKDAVVMSWREEVEGGTQALKRGNHVIMTPTSHCYLDYYQDAPYSQPIGIGGYIPVKQTYSFEPIPKGTTDKSLVLGVQGNLWTEYVPTESHADYMAFPRMLAVAEVGWTSPSLKSYADFHQRALSAVDYLKSKGYHPFDLKNEIGPRPEAQQPLNHLGVGKKIAYLSPYNPDRKASGDNSLIDGILGDWNSNGYRWQGFTGNMDVVIDLNAPTDIHSITASFLQVVTAALYSPEKIQISVSDNGKDYTTLYDKDYQMNVKERFVILPFGWTGNVRARYVRYHATRNMSWGNLITDEVIIK